MLNAFTNCKNHTIQELSRKQFLVFQMYKNIFVLQVLFQSAQNRLSRFEKDPIKHRYPINPMT